MIPAPKGDGRNLLLVKRYKLSIEDPLQVGQQHSESAFLSEQSEILIHRIRRNMRPQLLLAFGGNLRDRVRTCRHHGGGCCQLPRLREHLKIRQDSQLLN